MARKWKIATALLLTVLTVFSVGIAGVYPSFSAENETTGDVTVSTDEVDWDLVKQQHQVSTVSPSNVTINLFDYWTGSNRNDPEGKDNNGDGYDDANLDNFINLGINRGHALLFRRSSTSSENVPGHGWWNHSQSGGKVYPNLVKNTLQSGYPQLTITEAQIDEAVNSKGAPQLTNGAVPEESLAYLFDPDNNNNGEGQDGGKESFADVQGLLQLKEDGTYFYDSRKYFAEFNEETNNFAIYDIEKTEAERTDVESDNYRNINVGFFPFNTVEQTFTYTKEGSDNTAYTTHMKMNPAFGDRTNMVLNHYMGLTLEVDFQQPLGGQVSAGQDMTFHFSGDDDVWIFIDDVLVADLGGIHGRQSVDINFASGEITYGATSGMSQTNLMEQFKVAGKVTDTDFNGNTFSSTSGTHTLKMFYLERGHNESNLELSFNLVAPVNSKIIKLDQNGDPVQNATFDLYYATKNKDTGVYTIDKEKENKGLLASGLTTDQNGEVELIGTDGQPITFTHGQHYILKETKAPPGYESPQNSDSDKGEIWLYCETFDKTDANDGDSTTTGENLLLVDEKSRWETGAISNITVAVTQTGETLEYRGIGKNGYSDPGELINGLDTIRNGLILAVPWMRQADSDASDDEYQGMAPIYGSNLDGYHFAGDEINPNNHLSLLQAAFKAAMYQIYYAQKGDGLGYQNWYMAWYDGEERYYGTLTDLPGNAAQYLWTEGNAGNSEKIFSVAYYFLDWNTVYSIFGAAGPTGTASVKLDAIAGRIQSYIDQGQTLDTAIDELMEDIIEESDGDTPGNFAILDSEDYSRQFAMRLYVPNMVRELQVQKVDEDGQALPGVEFCLTSNDDSSQSVTGTTDSNGMLVFSARGNNTAGSAKIALEPGSYTLTETRSPANFKENTKATTGIDILVTEHDVYADAGDVGDGVMVCKGLGKLLQSMVRYANGVNITLQDIQITEWNVGNIGIINSSGQTSNLDQPESAQAPSSSTLNLHYGLDSAYLEYGNCGDPSAYPFLETDTGVMGLKITQNTTAHSTDETDEYYNPYAKDDDLKGYDISNLFSGSTTVVVTNEKESANTGTLTVRKEVLTQEASDDTKKTSFPFSLSFGAGAVPKGEYEFAIYYTGKVRTSGTITVDETGQVTKITENSATSYVTGTTFILKDGYYLSVTGLPMGAQATVTETGVEGKKYTVYVTDDSSSTATKNLGTTNGASSSVNATTSLGTDDSTAYSTPVATPVAAFDFNDGTLNGVGSDGTSISGTAITHTQNILRPIEDGRLNFNYSMGTGSYNMVQWENPLKDKADSGFTISMLMEPNGATEINAYEGLFGFEKSNGAFFGVAGDGSTWYNNTFGNVYGEIDGNKKDDFFDFWTVSGKDNFANRRTLISQDDGAFLFTVTVKEDRITFYKNSALVYQITKNDVGEENSYVFQKILRLVNEADYFNLGSAAPVYWGTAGFSADFVRLYNSTLNQDQVAALAANYAPEAQLLFENVEVADLYLYKDVDEVSGVSADTKFDFDVTLTLPAEVKSGTWNMKYSTTSKYFTAAPGQTVNVEEEAGDSTTIQLSQNDSNWVQEDGKNTGPFRIENLPVGTEFTIKEDETGYYTTITPNLGNYAEDIVLNQSTVGNTITGTLSPGKTMETGQGEGKTALMGAKVTFTNRLATLTVVKQDGAGQPLPGAKFTLTNSTTNKPVGTEMEATAYKRVDLPEGAVPVNGRYTDENGTHIVQTEVEGEKTTYFYYAPVGESYNGTKYYVAIFTGLDPNGTYILKETGSPSGYIPSSDINVTIEAESDLDPIRTVVNHQNVTLPSTGWNPFLLGGIGLLLLGAGVVLLLQKRRKKIS